jgi:hypothetical protein
MGWGEESVAHVQKIFKRLDPAVVTELNLRGTTFIYYFSQAKGTCRLLREVNCPRRPSRLLGRFPFQIKKIVV